MKKIYAFLAMALLSMSAMAGTTFTFANSVDKQTKDGFSVELSKAEGLSAPAVNTTKDPEVRLYASNTITVSGEGITRIDLTFSKQGTKEYATLSVNPGTLKSGGESTAREDQKTDVWTGDADKVTFTLGSKGQRIIYSIVINGDGSSDEGGDKGDDGDKGDEVVISGLMYADAYYWTDEEGYGVWDIDLYKDYDYETYEMTYPEVYLQIDAESKTSLVGTYPLYYAGYWKSANDSIESDIYAEDFVGELTISYAKGEYTFEGSFEGTDGKIYSFQCNPEVFALDLEEYEEIELDEEGQGVENVATEQKVVKTIENGQLIIRRGENSYNVMGVAM